MLDFEERGDVFLVRVKGSAEQVRRALTLMIEYGDCCGFSPGKKTKSNILYQNDENVVSVAMSHWPHDGAIHLRQSLALQLTEAKEEAEKERMAKEEQKEETLRLREENRKLKAQINQLISPSAPLMSWDEAWDDAKFPPLSPTVVALSPPDLGALSLSPPEPGATLEPLSLSDLDPLSPLDHGALSLSPPEPRATLSPLDLGALSLSPPEPGATLSPSVEFPSQDIRYRGRASAPQGGHR